MFINRGFMEVEDDPSWTSVEETVMHLNVTYEAQHLI